MKTTKIMKDMKTTFKLMLLACFMVCSSASYAQKAVPAIDQAFGNFVQSLLQEDLVTSSTMNTYNIGMMKGYEFSIPEKKQKLLDTFHKALLTNSSLAYSSFTRKAGSASTETNRVGYGNDNALTYEFGTHKDRNYNLQYFRDRKDSTMRYVYALVWYPAKGERVMGSVYKFYSKDPRTYRKTTTSTSTTVNQDGSVTTRTIVVGPDGIERKYITEDADVQGLDSLVALGKNIKFKKTIARTFESDMTPPEDAAGFIVQFNSLRAAFKNAKDQYPYFGNQVTRRTLQTGVANKIVKLCKGYGKLLNVDEKNFCASSLNKMKKDTDDDYLQSLLEMTASALRK